jgi:hypothetical protein
VLIDIVEVIEASQGEGRSSTSGVPGGRKDRHERGAIALFLPLKLIFFTLLLGDFGIFIVRSDAALRNFPITLVVHPLCLRFNGSVGSCCYARHFIAATGQGFVDALFLDLGD